MWSATTVAVKVAQLRMEELRLLLVKRRSKEEWKDPAFRSQARTIARVARRSNRFRSRFNLALLASFRKELALTNWQILKREVTTTILQSVS